MGIAVALAAEPVTGDPGATVGAVVGAMLLACLAVALWPHVWSAEERGHHELDAIWHEARTDADAPAAWDRYAAWAEADGHTVELFEIICGPTTPRVGGAPSPFRREAVCRLDAEDIATAAEAMERLRTEVAERELLAAQRHDEDMARAEQLEHERTLHRIDEEARAELRARQEQLARELGQQESAERRALAEAVARGLRRP